ncbi:MAG: PRTRC system protein C [Bryobacteraceae bacterium]
MNISTLPREFEFSGVLYPDPDPSMSPEEVRDLYAASHPELTTASILGPELKGKTQRYQFQISLGTKG